MAKQSDAPTTTSTTPSTVKRTEVTGDVVLKTDAFNVEQPVLIDAAEKAFREQVADVHGEGTLTDVAMTGFEHHIGHSARYTFNGVLEK